MSVEKLKKFRSLFLIGVTAIGVQSAGAATVTWTQWASSSAGTIGLSSPVSLTYTGQTTGLLNDYPSWTPAGSFAGGVVDNAPPSAFKAVALTGGNTTQHQITFSSPVVNPVMAIWSLGSGSHPASFEFDEDEVLSLQAGGSNAEYAGSTLAVSGQVVSGAEGNGTLEFIGTYDELTWTNPTYEDYYAFTVGVAGDTAPAETPEPASLLCVGTGLAALAFLGLKKRARTGR